MLNVNLQMALDISRPIPTMEGPYADPKMALEMAPQLYDGFGYFSTINNENGDFAVRMLKNHIRVCTTPGGTAP